MQFPTLFDPFDLRPQDLIDTLEKDDEALKHDDADWASHIRSITGVPSDTSDFARTIMPASISRAIKTLLAYRALDIACYVLELAPERRPPQPMAKPDNQNAVSFNHPSRPFIHPLNRLLRPLSLGIGPRTY